MQKPQADAWAVPIRNIRAIVKSDTGSIFVGASAIGGPLSDSSQLFAPRFILSEGVQSIAIGIASGSGISTLTLAALPANTWHAISVVNVFTTGTGSANLFAGW